MPETMSKFFSSEFALWIAATHGFVAFINAFVLAVTTIVLKGRAREFNLNKVFKLFTNDF